MFGNALCKIIVRDFLDLFIFYLVIGDGLLTVVFCDFFLLGTVFIYCLVLIQLKWNIFHFCYTTALIFLVICSWFSLG